MVIQKRKSFVLKEERRRDHKRLNTRAIGTKLKKFQYTGAIKVWASLFGSFHLDCRQWKWRSSQRFECVYFIAFSRPGTFLRPIVTYLLLDLHHPCQKIGFIEQLKPGDHSQHRAWKADDKFASWSFLFFNKVSLKCNTLLALSKQCLYTTAHFSPDFSSKWVFLRTLNLTLVWKSSPP